MPSFASNLKRLRKSQHLSQEDVAQQLHTTRHANSSWETGRCQPDLDMLTALADVLHADIRELLYGKKPEGYPRCQKRFLIATGICGGITAAFIVFWTFFLSAVRTYCATHYLGSIYYFLYFGLPQLGFFAAGLFLAAGFRLVAPTPMNRWQRNLCLILSAVLAIPAGLLLISALTGWQPSFVVYLHRIMLYPSGRAFFLMIFPLLSGAGIFLSIANNDLPQ